MIRAGVPFRFRSREAGPGEDGFSLVEIIAATTILMVIVISLSNVLVDSLTASLLSRQREAAASIASDSVENAKGLGYSGTTALVSGTSCPAPSSGTPSPTVPVAQTASSYLTSYRVQVDTTVYGVCTSVVTPPATADTVTVTVTWPGAQTYTTSSRVGA